MERLLEEERKLLYPDISDPELLWGRIREARTVAEIAKFAPKPPALVRPPFGAPQPDPVLWRDSHSDHIDAVLSVGEVAVLSGPGNEGKSTVTIALARAADPDDPYNDEDYGRSCGIRVACGRVAMLSYEDSGARMAGRLGWYGPDERWEHLRKAPDGSPPLWTADPEDRRASRRSSWWDHWWDAVAEWDPVLVVIDPVSVAFSGAHPSDGAAVRAFLAALTQEAVRVQCGVLLVAHDNKAARHAVAAGENPGAHAIAGTSQWYDGVRGALHFAGGVVRCNKASYGRREWGAALVPRWADPQAEAGFQGWKVDRHLRDAEAVKGELARRRAEAKGGEDSDERPASTSDMVLAALGKSGGVGVAEISEAVGLSRSGVNNCLSRLVDKGLADRELADPDKPSKGYVYRAV